MIGRLDDIKGKFSKKYSKFFLSEIVRRMKLKLAILAKDIAFYKTFVFYFGRIRNLVAMATYSLHRLKGCKLEISTVSLGIIEFIFTEMFIE